MRINIKALPAVCGRLFMLLAVAVAVIIAVNLSSGCKSTSPLAGSLGNTLQVSDYRASGEAVGEAGYYAYSFLKQDAKYAKYTQRCEEIYKALEAAQGGDADASIDVAAINDAALQVLQVVLAAKYGPTQAALITAGARIGVGFAYNLVKQKIPEDKLSVYLDGVWAGIQRAKRNGADLISEPTEIDKLISLEPSEGCDLDCVIDKVSSRLNAGGLTEYDLKRLKNRLKVLKKQKAGTAKAFDCKDGNCIIVIDNRSISFQTRVAQQLIDDGYAVEGEVVKEGHNTWQNCKDLIERCKVLNKFGVDETRCYIHDFTIEKGVLKTIEFRMIGFEGEFVTDCVACCVYLELEDIPDDIEF